MAHKCLSCKVTVKKNDKAVECSICERWFHIACQKEPIDLEVYNALQKSTTKVHCYCDDCECGAKSLNKKMVALEISHQRLEGQLKRVEEALKEKPSKDEVQEMIQTQINDVLENKMDEAIDSKIEGLEKTEAQDKVPEDKICAKVIAEIKERENRSGNIVIHGIDESTSEEANESLAQDSNVIDQIMKEIQVQVTSAQMKIRRLGKREPNKKRPVLATMRDDKAKKSIMENAKKLKDSAMFKQIGISHDLTKVQREDLKNMREEAKAKSTAEKTFIVIGMPGSWKIVERKTRPPEEPEN